MRASLIAALVLMTSGAVGAGQDAEVRAAILKKAKEVYGDAAPLTVTFMLLDDIKKGPPTAGAADRESVVGIEMERKGNQAYIDASPCDLKIVVFTAPFSRTDDKRVKCKGVEVQTYKYVRDR
jgi:hypothetical protein